MYLSITLGRQGSARTGHQHDTETTMNRRLFGLGLNLDRTNKTAGSTDGQENAIQLKTCFHFFRKYYIRSFHYSQFHIM